LNVPSKLKVKSTQNLVWNNTGASKINISLYSGGILKKHIATNIDNNGSYSWKIDDSFKGKNLQIRLVDVNNANNYCSSNVFAVESKKPTIIYVLFGVGAIAGLVILGSILVSFDF
jgi:hypothetical protein